MNYFNQIYKALLVSLLVIVGCTNDFEEINSDPSVVNDPNIRYFFTYAEDKLVTYQGTEWVWEYMEHLLRYSQHVTADPYELSGNVNSRYPVFYTEILPNLVEIREEIDKKEDVAPYQNMKMATYILQILHAIKVSDMNGAIPYDEASLARYEGIFDPVYNQQDILFTIWLDQLDEAIQTISANLSGDQESFGEADLFYQGDWVKWVKLANTLKLRIAARVQNQDAAQAAQIFQEVMQDGIGPIDSDEAQMVYSNDNYTPFGTGGDIDYRSRRFATSTIMDYLKRTNDPRLAIYFEENDLTGSYRDSLDFYGLSLPEFIDPDDPLIQYQGGPVDWSLEPEVSTYFNNPIAVGTNRYFLISPINRKFFSPKLNNANGIFTNVIVSYAESCFYIAEFIEKGYGSGSTEEWYNRGIASSIRTMNMIAEDAQSDVAFNDDGAEVIATYLSQPDVTLNGVNDLERIYIQQYLQFYRQPNEAFVFTRRTGYPTFDSEYYPRQAYSQVIPRRFWLDDPGEVNREHWENAMQEQGFTPRSQDVQDLNEERIWYDKTAPDFGMGN